MALKIFLTGATGYVGGEVLYQLSTAESGRYQISCLVRDQGKASTILEKLPDISIIEGDLDNVAVVEAESSKADVVLSLASTKHGASSEAIVRGLTKSGRSGPAYWIQMSGASLFCGAQTKAGTFGEAGGKEYDNVVDQDEIWSLVQQTSTRVVEQLVLAQDPEVVKTALIIGPLIYGTGQGPVNTRSIQGPEITKYGLQNGRPFQVGSGQSAWSNIHVQDLGSLIVQLVEATQLGISGIWNREGAYCPENGIMTWGALAQAIAKSLKEQGYTTEEGVETFSTEQINNFMGHGAILLGTNAKQKETRAREKLGWIPSQPSLEDFIPEMIEIEATRLGRSPLPK